MIDIYSRHRPLALLAAVVFAQILLLAFQIKREHDVPLIRFWAAELITPVGRLGTWSTSKVHGVWYGYIALHGANGENERLRDEVNQLRIQNANLETQAAEAQRLSVLLNFRNAHSEAQMLAAQVIGASADPSSHTLFVNRGERDHVRRNMAVITPDGIVGKIVEVLSNNTSQVLLINDKDSGVGALFTETRTHGVIKGTGDPDPRMDYVVNDEKVHPGEILITSGEDRIFPKGLLVGKVSDAAPGNPFQVIHVQPAARLDRLEDVLILISQDPLTDKNVEASPAAEGADGTVSTQPAAVQGIVQPIPVEPAPLAAPAPVPTGGAPGTAPGGAKPAAAPKKAVSATASSAAKQQNSTSSSTGR